LISQQLDTPNYRPRKRKHAPELSDASNSALTTASDAAVAGTQGQGPDASRLRDSPPPPGPDDDSQDKQLHLSGSGRGCIPISPASASPNPLESASSPAPSTHEGQSPSSDVLPAEFAGLKEVLRAKGPTILMVNGPNKQQADAFKEVVLSRLERRRWLSSRELNCI
jgi:hypothetical protein